MSYLVLILSLQSGSESISTSTMKLDVDVKTCETVAIPDAKKQYVNSPIRVVSARCFPVTY
ncbi:hypothetical protein GAP32_340 [Cronobacter phage vB_CsaM_GAP32]|uniref:Uncharacterized protein n=1 Tax=Cronobacter phage vB_CsaM_GAP32 TaxID=1141136 RepID=K4F9M8_9CAUD|nr:hypothetical protein GAP32_340 [Cronobacter phage vB_CsaM_GAP32]AFC21790.1 hypothetical protein GAP32_340 [Cronobacter phage vB_CsaM_GAP32]